jgi:hypothetical protein
MKYTCTLFIFIFYFSALQPYTLDFLYVPGTNTSLFALLSLERKGQVEEGYSESLNISAIDWPAGLSRKNRILSGQEMYEILKYDSCSSNKIEMLLVHSYGLEVVLSFLKTNNKSKNPITIGNIIAVSSPITHWGSECLSEKDIFKNVSGDVCLLYSEIDWIQTIDFTESWGFFRIRRTLPITKIAKRPQGKIFNLCLPSGHGHNDVLDFCRYDMADKNHSIFCESSFLKRLIKSLQDKETGNYEVDIMWEYKHYSQHSSICYERCLKPYFDNLLIKISDEDKKLREPRFTLYVNEKENKKRYLRWNYSFIIDRIIPAMLMVMLTASYIAYKKGLITKDSIVNLKKIFF